MKVDLKSKYSNSFQEKLRDMDAKEIGLMLHHVKAGADVKKAAFEVPLIDIEATIQPITRTVLRVRLVVEPKFRLGFFSHLLPKPRSYFYVCLIDGVARIFS